MELFVRRNMRSAIAGAALAGTLLFCSVGAVAGNITLSGTGQMYWTAQFLGSAAGDTQSTPTPTGTSPTGNTYSLAVPGQYAFLDQFTAPQSSPLVDTSVVPNVPFENTGGPVGTYSFQDSYEFSVGMPATGDVLAVSLALQQPLQNEFNISDLQFRLYEVLSSATAPSLTIPTGSRVLVGWQGLAGNDNGQSISANFSNMQSGTYFLDIAGTADGTSGGTYVGQLNLHPVPVPAGLGLLLSGIAGLVMVGQRRKLALA